MEKSPLLQNKYTTMTQEHYDKLLESVVKFYEEIEEYDNETRAIKMYLESIIDDIRENEYFIINEFDTVEDYFDTLDDQQEEIDTYHDIMYPNQDDDDEYDNSYDESEYKLHRKTLNNLRKYCLKQIDL
jgi:hypothetical protein